MGGRPSKSARNFPASEDAGERVDRVPVIDPTRVDSSAVLGVVLPEVGLLPVPEFEEYSVLRDTQC
jgi:hypothetical protein